MVSEGHSHAMCPSCGTHMSHMEIPMHVAECKGDREWLQDQHDSAALHTRLRKASELAESIEQRSASEAGKWGELRALLKGE